MKTETSIICAPPVLGDFDFDYPGCPECGDHRVNVHLDARSEAALSEEAVAFLAFPQFALPRQPLHAVRVACVRCDEDIPQSLLPERLLDIGRNGPVFELILTAVCGAGIESSGRAGTEAAAEPPSDGDLANDDEDGMPSKFGCPRCSDRQVEMSLAVFARYADEKRRLKHPPAKIDETRLRRARCMQCGYVFLDGSLPSEIHILGEFSWTISVYIGHLIFFLDIKNWLDTIARAERHAYIAIISRKYEMARRLVRRMIKALCFRAAELDQPSGSESNCHTRRHTAWNMRLRAESLQEKFLNRPLPVFDSKQCVNGQRCPYLWTGSESINTEPPCFPWTGGQCRLKVTFTNDMAIQPRRSSGASVNESTTNPEN